MSLLSIVVTAASLMIQGATYLPPPVPVAEKGVYLPEPQTNMSAIRRIICKEGYGTGFMVGDDIVATANHVASSTDCKDEATGKPLRRYHKDEKHDFALMSGKLPDMPYIKVGCGGYAVGKEYDVYGYSAFRRPASIFQHHVLKATKEKTDSDFKVGPERTPMPGMRYLEGYVVPGLSGSPIIHKGYAVGVVNVGVSAYWGLAILPKSYSYELKDTTLCQRQPSS